MMRSTGVLAVVTGIAIAAAVSGADRALVAMPAPLIAVFGLAGLGIALTRQRGRAIPALALGLALGFSLPRSLPVGQISMHAPGRSDEGDLFALLDRLDADPRAMAGRRVVVSGDWTPPDATREASVSQRIMACCAADMVDVGLDVVPRRAVAIRAGSLVCVSGVLASRVRDGDLRYRIVRAIVREHACRR